MRIHNTDNPDQEVLVLEYLRKSEENTELFKLIFLQHFPVALKTAWILRFLIAL